MNNLFVRQLPFSTTSESLRPLFEPYGEIIELKVPMEAPGKNKGFAFVTFASVDDGANAIRNLNGAYFEGKNIVVAVSEKRGGGGGPPAPYVSQQQPAVARSRSPSRSTNQRAPRSPPRYAAPQQHRAAAAPLARQRYEAATTTTSNSMDGKIYISGLPPHTTEEMLVEHFSMSGKVARKRQARGYPDQWPYNIKLYTNDKHEFRGDALLTYEDPNASITAPGFFDGGDFHGSTISVQVAKKDY